MIPDYLSLPVFKHISDIVSERGVKAFVIGGYVRDWYLHRPSTDIDVVVAGSGIEVAEELGRRVHSRVSVFKNFGTAMLRVGGVEVEFVGARKESYRADSRKPIVEDGTLEDDQRRRDFTINALAWSLGKEDFGTLVDPFGGMDDLEHCIIRTPCDPDTTFSDDPLRMIRAVRFASQLGFDIWPETFDAIVRNRERIRIVSRERIATELHKIVASPRPSIGFELSVGGPVVAPGCDCLVLSPIAPHNLTMRPVVVPGESTLSFKVSTREKRALVTLDNRNYQVEDGATFKVSKSKNSVFLVRLQNISFYDTLRNKMMWGFDRRDETK